MFPTVPVRQEDQRTWRWTRSAWRSQCARFARKQDTYVRIVGIDQEDQANHPIAEKDLETVVQAARATEAVAGARQQALTGPKAVEIRKEAAAPGKVPGKTRNATTATKRGITPAIAERRQQMSQQARCKHQQTFTQWKVVNCPVRSIWSHGTRTTTRTLTVGKLRRTCGV